MDDLVDQLIQSADAVDGMSIIDRARIVTLAAEAIRELHGKVASVDSNGRKENPPSIVSRLESVARFPSSHSSREMSLRLLEAVQVLRSLEAELEHRNPS